MIVKCPGSLATGGEVVYSTLILLGEGDADVDIKNLLLCLQFQFDLLASLSHSARSSVMGTSLSLRLSLGLFMTLYLNFPLH